MVRTVLSYTPLAHVGRIGSLVLAALCLLTIVQTVQAQETRPDAPPVRYDQDHADPAFHQGRRQALLEEVPDSAVIVVLSAPVRTRDNDVSYAYRQSSDLYYLTGTHEPGSALLLVPHGIEVDGEQVQEVLFVPERTSFSDTWLGRRFGTEGAESELGIAKALPLEAFASTLSHVMSEGDPPLYLLPPGNGIVSDSELANQLETVRSLQASQPDAQVHALHLRRALDYLRSIKQPEELRLMQRAIDITSEAHRAAMRSAEPGMHEYELEAIIEYVFHRSGAEDPAFTSIVGSGENAVILHYETNRRQMQDGDLVVMDIGAEYHGYAADVTRTIPVSGTFTDDQRAMYELVLQAQEAAIEAARAGAAFGAPHQVAQEVVAAGLREMGILSADGDVRQFFMHGTSHYLGLGVHDVGPRNMPLEPGMVITIEPGIYFAPSDAVDPRWWNIGIRIEDDVLITDDAPQVLSASAPKTVEEVEAVMAEGCEARVVSCF